MINKSLIEKTEKSQFGVSGKFPLGTKEYLPTFISNLDSGSCEPEPQTCPELPIKWLGSKFTQVKMKDKVRSLEV